jgi:AraC-like DNA-binding protein
MNKSSQKIGSWNGLTLIRQIGPSSSGAHQHACHMLRLQMRSVIANEWRSGATSGTTIMEPGSLAVISANAHHGKCSDKHDGSGERPQHMIALLTESLLEKAAEAASARNGGIQLQENRHFRDLQLERLLWILHDEAFHQGPANPLFGDTVSHAIAMHLAGNYATMQRALLPYRGGIPPRQLKRVLDYIQVHLNHDLPLSALAEAAAMSPFHFSRAFRKSVGKSPHRYVLAQKIERAKSLLRGNELTVGEISLSTGFARQNHFARVFQRMTGLTPTEFRRRPRV